MYEDKWDLLLLGWMLSCLRMLVQKRPQCLYVWTYNLVHLSSTFEKLERRLHSTQRVETKSELL